MFCNMINTVPWPLDTTNSQYPARISINNNITQCSTMCNATAVLKKSQADSPVTRAVPAIKKMSGFSSSFLIESAAEGQHYSLYNVETGVYGVGPTKQEAVEDFIDNISDYAQVYFNDLTYYLSHSGGRREHYWYLRRILQCDGDREKLFHVLGLNKALVD